MKTTRRILSMVLALMMVLSLSVTAFADTTTGTATISVYNQGTKIKDLTVNAGTLVRDALNAAVADARVTELTAISWTEVSGYPNTHTPHYALDTINRIAAYAGTTEDLDGYEDFADVTEDDAVEGYDGYYLVDQNNGYHYVYVGYSWVYYSQSGDTKTDIWVYMCDYAVSEGENVVVSFEKTVTDWTQDNPIG